MAAFIAKRPRVAYSCSYVLLVIRVAQELKMAEKGSVSLPNWQLALLKRHETELIARMATKEVVDHLVAKRWMNPAMDVYQTIELQTTIPNQRARLLLKFIRSSTDECFWSFQQALAKTGCADLSVTRKDQRAVERSFSPEELTAAYYSEWREGRPAAVVDVNKQLKEQYRALQMRSVTDTAGAESVSLDDIQVNICLLSADKLSALCGSPGQKEPLTISTLKDKESSVIELEDVFQHDMHDRIQTSGIAGSGKSTAFMQKAPYEWAKVNPPRGHRPFWPHIALFFRGSLTNKKWWKARKLTEIFWLSRFNLTRKARSEVVRFIKSHSEQVLLVADALDEATVDEDSLLWEILTGKCEDLSRLKLIILSRPCERALWLSKNCLFHRRLEVVGFTDAKIARFVQVFFARTPQKALELQAQLSNRANVSALMHTPLLATLLCCLFQLDMALPSTQTGVYRSSVLAMLRQSCGRAKKKAPKNILDELSPPELQVTMENLCKLAYDTLKETEAVFTETQLSSASCLSAAGDLGFLSSSPCVGIEGHNEDAYSFQHHTMQEFFAALHAVRESNRAPEKKSIGDLVAKLGVDGDYARFWPFVSGLLSGPQCESLLSAIADKVTAARDGRPPELSRLLLLLLHCHSECVTELPREGSQAVAMVMKSIGLQLTFTHVSASDARATADILRLYSSSVENVNLFSTMMDDSSASIIIAGLQSCTQLTILNPGMTSNAADSQAVAKVIEQNKSSLRGLTIPVGDEDLPSIAPSVTACSQLVSLAIGSRALTNKSAPAVADTL